MQCFLSKNQFISGKYLSSNANNRSTHFSCTEKEIYKNDLINNVDSDIQYLWAEVEKSVAKARDSILSERYSTTSMEYQTMAFILAGLGATTLSGVRFLTMSNIQREECVTS